MKRTLVEVEKIAGDLLEAACDLVEMLRSHAVKRAENNEI